MELFLKLVGHERFNEVQTLAQVFYPNRRYVRVEEVQPSGITIESAAKDNVCTAFVYEGGLLLLQESSEMAGQAKSSLANAVKTSIYKALARYTGLKPQWGILTGIRPAKLVRELMAEAGEEGAAVRLLEQDYLVSSRKAHLAAEVAAYESRILSGGRGKALPSLYIGIPFCPTRCVYCSFTSYPMDKYKDKVDAYLDCLIKEIASLPDTALDCIYIGGGTPTSLEAHQLETLLGAVLRKFGGTTGSFITEFTVEAGRPDTITPERLAVLRDFGVDRISINPQTMNDSTLEKIGRKHSAAAIECTFHMAREAGFENINMDLIVGLPDETPEMVTKTMDRIFKLNPPSITVHTLAVKRASRLNEALSSYSLTPYEEVEKMLAIAENFAAQMDMKPYYMYRQKNMLGNFENVGYCKEGFHSEYNIKIMEETQTIMAVGAGAVTKIVQGERIERVFNLKNVDEYIQRIDEAVERKRVLHEGNESL